jgi:hypothetical protein
MPLLSTVKSCWTIPLSGYLYEAWKWHVVFLWYQKGTIRDNWATIKDVVID